MFLWPGQKDDFGANFPLAQGCQMVYFQTKNPNLGKFFRPLDLKNIAVFYGHLECFKNKWDIL
jgi:hypothetical protein